VVTVVVGIGYLIVAVLALPVIAGDEYRVVVPWMWPIVLGYILLGGYRIGASYLYSAGRTGVLSMITVAGAALNAVANTATHVDAPRHFLSNGRTMGSIRLIDVIGPAEVVDFGDAAAPAKGLGQ
jgi:hypothetical protein